MNKNLKLANDPAGLNATEVQLPENAAAALGNMLQALSKLPAVILELAELFTAKGEELSLVGGPVRDAMCGRKPHDWDLATSARPDTTEQILKDWAGNVWTMGKEFGTIGAH
ncbi:MAG: CCA tRNA nucleotidyltransferase, partial [Varibaculum cambriense]|nr:CCA tRNA nucleotidyltransferase [Varibaculum cambriense]